MSPEEHDLADTAIQHGGWIAAMLVATWGWIVKKSLGDVGKTMERVESKVDDALKRISRIEGHLGLNGYKGTE